jgi:hypothetical protein
MKNTIKTTLATLTLAASLSASAGFSEVQGAGMGIVGWYSNTCQEMSIEGQALYGMVMLQDGVTAETLALQPGVLKGYLKASEYGCATTKVLIKSSGAYDIYFK